MDRKVRVLEPNVVGVAELYTQPVTQFWSVGNCPRRWTAKTVVIRITVTGVLSIKVIQWWCSTLYFIHTNYY